MEPIRFACVGVGGYAGAYVRGIGRVENEGGAKFVCAVIRSPKKYAKQIEELTAKGVEVINDYAEALEKCRGKVDVFAIPTSIEAHRKQVIPALEAGYDVLVEKPPAATVQDVDAMVAARDKAGKMLSGGFQNAIGVSALLVKEAVVRGELGEIREGIAIGRMQRPESYYARAAGAGKVRIGEDWVLDGPINNPLAHLIHQGLFLASREPNGTLEPKSVRAELYREHKIDGEDTACLLAELAGGVKMYGYFSLCNPKNERGTVEIVGTKGSVLFRLANNGSAVFKVDGQEREIDDGGKAPRVQLFRHVAGYMQKTQDWYPNPIEITRPYMLVVNGAYESAQEIRTIPAEAIDHPREVMKGKTEEDELTVIRDIGKTIEQACAERKLFSELGVSWASKTEAFDLAGYREFPQRFKAP